MSSIHGKSDDKRLEKIESSIKWYRVAAFVCIAVGFLSIIVVWHQNKYVSPMKWNEVGDYLGGTMVGFWSLAGLFFIYVAFLGQRLDIQLTKNELQETRKVHNRHTTLINRQQFDNLFFNLVQTHIQIVADLDASFYVNDTINGGWKNSNSQGRDVFKDGFAEYFEDIEEGEKRIESYGNLYNEKRGEFGHYYRFLYRMIDTVNNKIFVEDLDFNGDISFDEYELIKNQMNFKIQYEYTGIVRSLLSDDELELLFYNMLFFQDLKFKPLIEKYTLLKNIPNGQEKVDNTDYDFHSGAIFKERNPRFN